MLQRIYGTAWDTQEELDQHLWRVEEAKKRDHRKLGRELDLFTFHPESPAAPFLHPRGMALWRSLEDWSRQVRREAGFSEVRTPSLVRKELWETSGHWNNYQDNMFVLDDYDHVSGLKPMNCPEEILIYRTRSRSYRELPMRFNDYSVLYPQGTHRRAGRNVPRPAADPGRLARLLPRRPGRRRDPPCALARPQAVRAVRLRAARKAGDAPGEVRRLRE